MYQAILSDSDELERILYRPHTTTTHKPKQLEREVHWIYCGCSSRKGHARACSLNKNKTKGDTNYLQQVRERKIYHIVHPSKFKGNIWPDDIITNKKACSKALFLPLQK